MTTTKWNQNDTHSMTAKLFWFIIFIHWFSTLSIFINSCIKHVLFSSKNRSLALKKHVVRVGTFGVGRLKWQLWARIRWMLHGWPTATVNHVPVWWQTLIVVCGWPMDSGEVSPWNSVSKTQTKLLFRTAQKASKGQMIKSLASVFHSVGLTVWL